MAKIENSGLDTTLEGMVELETFLFALLPAAAARRPKQGTDLLPYAKELGLTVPASLDDVPLTWASAARSGEKDDPVISIVRPGNPNALGFTIGCIDVRRWRICLECGWRYCRIVITRR